MLAAGLPLLRITMRGGALHPLFFGGTSIWWRSTGQTRVTLVAHEACDSMGFLLNPVIRVREGGQTLRRRVDVAVQDQLFDGTRIRILTIVDTFSRLSLAIDARQNFRGADVVETLARVSNGAYRGPSAL